MSEKISDKIIEIERYLGELESFLPSTFEEYAQNLEKKAACERYAEKIIEAVIDLAFLVLKEEGLPMPEEDKEAFDLLVNEKIIPAELSIQLKDAKGMRNILAHEYGVVDDAIVFEAVTEELVEDVEQFLDKVGSYVHKKKASKQRSE